MNNKQRRKQRSMDRRQQWQEIREQYPKVRRSELRTALQADSYSSQLQPRIWQLKQLNSSRLGRLV